MKEKLLEHAYHKIVIVKYGTVYKNYNVALECETCNVVLKDYDL